MTLFLRYKGIRVWHVYKNGVAANPRTFWFSLDHGQAGDEDWGALAPFDVRTLDTWPKGTTELHAHYLGNRTDDERRIAIRKAIAAGLIARTGDIVTVVTHAR